jgi:hypothetical protein
VMRPKARCGQRALAAITVSITPTLGLRSGAELAMA